MISQKERQLYAVNVTALGKDVPLFSAEKMIILFNENAPVEVRDISVLHSGAELKEQLTVGDVVRFDQASFRITAIGHEANRTLAELGHVTFRFDGSDTPALPGTIHLEEQPLPVIENGTKIQIIRSVTH